MTTAQYGVGIGPIKRTEMITVHSNYPERDGKVWLRNTGGSFTLAVVATADLRYRGI